MNLTPLRAMFALAAALALTQGLTACGGSDPATAPAPAPEPPPPPPPPPPSGDGPVVLASQLDKICPQKTTVGSIVAYTHCKASATDAQANQDVFGTINAWIAANADAATPPNGPGKVYQADGLKGQATDGSLTTIAVNDDCSFFLEPGLGIWMPTYQQAHLTATPSLAFAGTAVDEIDVDADGVVLYMRTGDFLATGGGMEVNFPGVTGGTVAENIWGVSGKFVFCKFKSS